MTREYVWTRAEAVALCVAIEKVCPPFGCHVALTGGALYKVDDVGRRKDADILFYRIRQAKRSDYVGLWAALEEIGLKRISGDDDVWLNKATYNGKPVDVFFPESLGGEYGEPVIQGMQSVEELLAGVLA